MKKFFIALLLITLILPSTIMAALSYEDDISREIEELNGKITVNKKQLEDLDKKQASYQKAILQKQAEQSTLKNQLSIIFDQIEQAKLEIEKAELEIDYTSLEIQKTSLEINNKEQKMAREKDHLATILKIVDRQGRVSTMEILLLNNSLSEFLDQAKYLQNTNEELGVSLGRLSDEKTSLEEAAKLLEEKKQRLEDLKTKLEDRKISLKTDEENKNFILQSTKQSEKQYQVLLAAAKKEQLQAAAEISGLEKIVRDKLSQKKNTPTMNPSGLIWPTNSHYITASFHDPDYPFKKSIGEHSGIDIRASQGSPLHAVADGYVARVKFNGSRAYSYIMIIHGNGLSSVYGHVSGVSVKADDYVTQGQTIGKSGGLPGTAGAGAFTTGAHLHFEVRKDGLPVNPLDYLP